MASGGPVYLDYNATAPVRPSACRAMVDALAAPGNPSSVHAFGRAARRLLEGARESVASLVGAAASGVIFTSGGTEANALALTAAGRRRVLASAVEHPSVLAAGVDQTIPVDRHGIVDLVVLDDLLSASSEPSLVAVMLANNETGVIQPLAEVVEIARRHGARIHCDAIQAAGRMAVDIAQLGVDSLSISAHKLGGPPGSGALVVADGEGDIVPFLKGGAQERRRRAGTENLPGIAGFAAAVEEVKGERGEAARLDALRERLERAARDLLPTVVVFGEGVQRLPNTTCLGLPGMAAQTAVMALDLAGVAISAGSACSSGKVGPSPVLTAMGAGPLAASAIRISLGWATGEQDVDRFIEAFGALARRLTLTEKAASAA